MTVTDCITEAFNSWEVKEAKRIDNGSDATKTCLDGRSFRGKSMELFVRVLDKNALLESPAGSPSSSGQSNIFREGK